MKKIISLLLCVVLRVFAEQDIMAQTAITEFGIRIKDPTDAMAISDTNGTIAYIFDGHRQYQTTIINSDNVVERNTSINKMPSQKKSKLIDLLLNEQNFVAIFYHKKLKTISSISLDRTTGDYRFHTLKTLLKDELFLTGFAKDNTFYFITVPKKQNEFFLYQTSDGKEVSYKKYNANFDGFYQRLSQNNNLLNYTPDSEVGIEVVDNYTDNSVKASFPRKKIYTASKDICITFDDKDGTHLLKIDTDLQKLTYKRLNFSLENGNNDPDKSGNSFIIDSTLCRLTMSSQQMNVSMININNMALINNYNYHQDEEIGIQNTALLQDEDKNTLFNTGNEKEISKTRKFFNKVLNSNISIAANHLDSGMIDLEIGAYEEYVYRNNAMTPMGMGFGMGMGMGMGFGPGMGMGGFGSPMYGPGMMYPGYYPFGPTYTNVVRKVVSFHSLMDAGNFDHLSGPMPKSIRERVSDYMQSKFKKDVPDLYSITYRGRESLLLGYYLEYKNQFVVVEFEK